MERSPKDMPNRRIVRPCDIPQNPKDAAALKLLAAVDRQPHVEIVRIACFTSGKGAERMAYLELRSADHPEDVAAGNLYARIELPLVTIVKTPLEELTALLKRRLTSLSAIASSQEAPPPGDAHCELVVQTTADAASVRRAPAQPYDLPPFNPIEDQVREAL